MAGEALAVVSPALTQSFSRTLYKVWNRQALLASILQLEDEGGVGDAKQVAWDVAFSGATAASFAEGSDIAPSEFNQDPLVPAVLPWGQYRAAFKLSNLEINAAARNQAGPQQLANLVALRLEGSLTKLISVFNADLYTGTGTDGSGNPNVVGLNTALAATGTYAAIPKATYPEWQGNVLGNGGSPRPLTFDLLANLEQLIFQSSGLEPTALVASAGVVRKYESLFEAGKITMNAGQAPVPGYQGSTSGGVTGPVTNLFWRGKPVIRDRNCPAGTLYMVNQNFMMIKPLPFNPLSPDGVPVRQMTAPSSNGQQFQPSPIQCVVYPLARTGSAIPFVAEVYIQLKAARTNCHGILQDISEV